MTEKLFKQVDGSEWSWSNLNKVCMYVCMYVYVRMCSINTMQYLPYIRMYCTYCMSHTMYTCVQYVPVFMCIYLQYMCSRVNNRTEYN